MAKISSIESGDKNKRSRKFCLFMQKQERRKSRIAGKRMLIPHKAPTHHTTNDSHNNHDSHNSRNNANFFPAFLPCVFVRNDESRRQ
eukprot:5012281-Ditylum_brightwellii.AAC.1